MRCLNLSRMDAGWYTPADTLYRMQKAYLENHGEEQQWSKSRLDKIMEMLETKEGAEDGGKS